MSPNSIKKTGVKFQFQLTNLDGDSGLGVTQSLRRFGETLQLNDFNKRMQLSNFHDVIPPRIIFLLYTSVRPFVKKEV